MNENNTSVTNLGEGNSESTSLMDANNQSATQQDVTENGDNQAQESSEANQGVDKTVSNELQPFHKNPRFRELVEEKNQYKAQLQELEAKLKSMGQIESKSISETPQNLGVYGEYLKDIQFKFRAPNEYTNIDELFRDFQQPLIDSVLSVLNGLNTKRQAEEQKSQAAIKTEMDEVEKFYQSNPDRREEFIKFATKAYERGSNESLLVLLDYFEELKGEARSIDSSRSEAQRKISTGNSAGSNTTPKGKYDPRKHRNLSMRDIVADLE